MLLNWPSFKQNHFGFIENQLKNYLIISNKSKKNFKFGACAARRTLSFTHVGGRDPLRDWSDRQKVEQEEVWPPNKRQLWYETLSAVNWPRHMNWKVTTTVRFEPSRVVKNRWFKEKPVFDQSVKNWYFWNRKTGFLKVFFEAFFIKFTFFKWKRIYWKLEHRNKW